MDSRLKISGMTDDADFHPLLPLFVLNGSIAFVTPAIFKPGSNYKNMDSRLNLGNDKDALEPLSQVRPRSLSRF